jgi:hypothetical protein
VLCLIDDHHSIVLRVMAMTMVRIVIMNGDSVLTLSAVTRPAADE